MKKIRFIINPVSGKNKQMFLPEIINKHIDKSLFDYEVIFTESAGHAKTLSREAAEAGCDIIAIAGGDGSVNEAGSALTGTETALAIIPTGSGNGLARHLKLPLNPEKAIRLINNHQIVKIDTGKINGKNFFNVAGVGFDASIGKAFLKLNKRGLANYIRLIFQKYWGYQSKNYSIEIDGKERKVEAFLVSFANSSQYGNNAVIAPQAVIDDGLLDVCILKKFPLTELPSIIIRLFNRNIHRSKYIEVLTGKRIVLHSTDLFHVDGEPNECEKELKIEINPLSLRVVCEKNPL